MCSKDHPPPDRISSTAPVQRSVRVVCAAVVAIATVARSAVWLVACAREKVMDRRVWNWPWKASKPPS